MSESAVCKGKLAVILYQDSMFQQNSQSFSIVLADPGTGENLPEPKSTGVLKKTNRYRSRSLSASSTDSYSSSCTGSSSDESETSPREKEQQNSKGLQNISVFASLARIFIRSFLVSRIRRFLHQEYKLTCVWPTGNRNCRARNARYYGVT